MEKELENVLAQDVYQEIITTLAYSEIAGMKNAFIQVQENKTLSHPFGHKEPNVGLMNWEQQLSGSCSSKARKKIN